MALQLQLRLQLVTATGGTFRFEKGAWGQRGPSAPKAGDIVEIKTIVTHPMESGNRKDKGALLPRNILNTFTASFAGDEVFRAELGPGVSANPYVAFFMMLTAPGDLVLTWRDDAGVETVERVPLPLTADA